MKRCSKCKIKKDLDCFHKNKKNKDGLKYNCKECRNIDRKLYYKNNKEKITEYQKEYDKNNKEKIVTRKKEYRKNNSDKIKAIKIKRRALKLELNEIFEEEHIKFVKFRFNYKCFNCKSTDSLHVDHHKPLSKGNILTLQNAVLLCQHCNLSKGPKDPEDFYTEVKLKELKKILRI